MRVSGGGRKAIPSNIIPANKCGKEDINGKSQFGRHHSGNCFRREYSMVAKISGQCMRRNKDIYRVSKYLPKGCLLITKKKTDFLVEEPGGHHIRWPKMEKLYMISKNKTGS